MWPSFDPWFVRKFVAFSNFHELAKNATTEAERDFYRIQRNNRARWMIKEAVKRGFLKPVKIG